MEYKLNSGSKIVYIIFEDQPYRNAGHSKWANIRHVKQANDMAKSREITKFVNFIKVAVRGKTKILNIVKIYIVQVI